MTEPETLMHEEVLERFTGVSRDEVPLEAIARVTDWVSRGKRTPDYIDRYAMQIYYWLHFRQGVKWHENGNLILPTKIKG